MITASATGHSIQQAEMNAAKKALENSKNLFPQLDHQKRVIANSLKRQKVQKPKENDSNENSMDSSFENMKNKSADMEARVPKQYQKRINIVSDASDISSSSLDEGSSDDSDSDGSNSMRSSSRYSGTRQQDDEDYEETIVVKPAEPFEFTMEPISSPELSDINTTGKQLEDVSSDLSEGEIDESNSEMK